MATTKRSKGKQNARETALAVLMKVFNEGAYANLALEKELAKTDLESRDRALVTELVNGVVRMKKHLEWVLGVFLARGNKKLPERAQWILLTGIYQILFMDRIPAYAAINEAVNMVRRDLPGLAALTNGVLRNVERQRDKLPFPDRNQDLTEYLAVRYSHPEWMVERWLARYGPETTEQLLMFNNTPPPLTVSVNMLKTNRARLAEMLRQEGVQVQDGGLSPRCLVLSGMEVPVFELTAYRSGLFYIQGESTMLIAPALAPEAGWQVADFCAGVGGKSIHLARIMQDSGTIFASELYAHKADLLQRNCRRMGITIVEPRVEDMMQTVLPDRSADAVLLDAPCTGLGVIRKRADLRWRRKEDDILKMAGIQTAMLERAARCVKPGGVLLYSTCTIEPEENEQVIMRFLESNPGFKPEAISGLQQIDLPEEQKQSGLLTLFSPALSIEGMFLARLRRVSDG